jgi:hypothetical protein
VTALMTWGAGSCVHTFHRPSGLGTHRARTAAPLLSQRPPNSFSTPSGEQRPILRLGEQQKGQGGKGGGPPPQW